MIEPNPRRGAVAASVATPWGFAFVAATDHGIAALELMTDRETFVLGLERRLGGTVRWIDVDARPAPRPDAGGEADRRADHEAAAVRHLRAAAGALRAAVEGDDRGRAEVALVRLPIALEDRPAWDRAVLEAVREIPRGQVRSYGQIARAIGRPGAARAVGGAVGRNPVAILIPCHRVVAADGTLGGYGGGWWGDRDRLLDLKAELLAREGISLPRPASPAGRGR
jgi:O-6-methylguanine DNA methyltransferase